MKHRVWSKQAKPDGGWHGHRIRALPLVAGAALVLGAGTAGAVFAFAPSSTPAHAGTATLTSDNGEHGTGYQQQSYYNKGHHPIPPKPPKPKPTQTVTVTPPAQTVTVTPPTQTVTVTPTHVVTTPAPVAPIHPVVPVTG